ncbi:MAG: hypothetical protein J0H61_13615 [Alphaproteobacteria bacterium]|jgi:hypothetical protein|nr:hypothetical protein [Alphaproteobacteria bacterium]
MLSRSGQSRREVALPSAGEILQMASDFAEEHGADACDYAYRAVVSFEAEGEGEKAHFWFLLLVMLGDIASHRLNPDKPLTIH